MFHKLNLKREEGEWSKDEGELSSFCILMPLMESEELV